MEKKKEGRRCTCIIIRMRFFMFPKEITFFSVPMKNINLAKAI